MLVQAEFHPKFAFLAEPHPFKIMYGGRDGMKSWAAAQQCVIDAAEQPLRILCARETMHSMKESVHELLQKTISRLGLGWKFEIKETEIEGRHELKCASCNGSGKTPGLVPGFSLRCTTCDGAGVGRSKFLFAGIKNAQNIKSYESCDRAWVEEGQAVSK